jgi:outer membrane protein
MKNWKQYIMMLVIAAICSGITYASVMYRIKKIAMIDAVSLFNEFKMKKELENDFKGLLRAYSQKVDSVNKVIKLIDPKASKEQISDLYRAYDFYKSKYESEFTASNQTVNEQVWKRLNPLLEEFGKAKGYNLILGANGMGTILYNDSYYDITKEVTEYVNSKYDNEK